MLEVLQDFKSCRPPLEWLLEACPLAKPRQFSIASSALAHPGEAHLTVAVVDWTTPYKRKRRGLCSSYLAGTVPAQSGGIGVAESRVRDHVAVWVERGKSLRMPEDLSVPLILVGPGTGVAPFRSFLEERAAVGREAEGRGAAPASAPAACSLFLGCRSLEADCLYLQQWRGLQRDGMLAAESHGLVIAASRDQPHKV